MTPSIIIHKGSDGSPRITAHIEAGSRRNFMLMEKDNITLKFTADQPEILHLGDFIEIENIGRYELTTPAKGEFDTATGGFKYEIQLDAQYWKFKNKLCKFLPQIGSNETSWNYTDTLPNHAQQILFNIRALSYERHDDGSETLKPGGRTYLYNGADDWLIEWDGSVDTTKAVTIEYDGRNIMDAIAAIAEAYECEWWFEGRILWFGKCEFGNTPITLEMGKEITAISRSTSQEEYVTRLFVYGSDRNLASNYRKTLVFIASNEGGKVHDPERPLDAAWFKNGTVTKTAKAEPRQAESFTMTQQKTVNSWSSNGQVAKSVILEKSLNITDPAVLDSQDFTALFSEINARIKIVSGKTGKYKAQGRVEITYPDGTFDNNYQCESTETESYIYSTSAEISVKLRDLVIKAKAKPKSIRISYSIWLEANEGTGVSRTLSCTIYGSLAIKAAALYEEWKATGVTIEVLDKTTGEVARTINGAIFNANLDGDNKLTLPSGQTMPDGTKYRLPQLNNAIVPARYFTSIYTIFEKYQDITTNGIVNSRLLLPDTTKGYIDVFPFESEEEAVEGVVVFEDVYPSRISKITSITRSDEYTDKQEEQDGSVTETKWRAFQFQDDLFNAQNPFSQDYLIEGKDLQITFQSGLLNGMTFDVAWMNEEKCFEIQRDDTTLLPNEYIKPQIGDEFILHGFNVAMLSDANTDYIDRAEQELLRKAQEYAERLNTDTNTYECTIAADVAYRTEEQTPDSLFLTIGRRVKLIHPSYFADGRISRVIGYEVPLDYAYDNPVYYIGEKARYSRLEAIEKSIEGIGYQSGNFGAVLGGSGSTGAGGGQYVITTEDPTPPTDRNLYSALRSRVEFALKTMRQSIEWLWTFLKGIRIGNYVKGYAGAAIDEAGNAEFESIESRSWLKVQELIYNRLNALEGDTSFSDVGTIEDIRSNEDGTQTAYIRMRWEGDFTAFQPGDVIFGYVNNLDNAEKKEWYKAWAWISEVDRQANALTLVAYPDSEVPAKKNFPMASGMVITRWGNNIEANQQTFVNPDYSAVIAKRGEGDYVNVRQSSFFISCEDGNLVELLGVRKPILEAGNYGTVLGKIPPGLLDDKTEELINKDQPYLYARGIIVQDLIRIGYEGVQTRTANYRGVWSREDANDPLRYYRSTAEVYDTVTWNGSLWQCLVQGTTDEPQKNCQGWLQMTAGPEEGETIHIWQIIPNANIISVRLKEVRPEKVTCSVVRNSSDNTTRTFNDSYELSLEGVALYYSLDGIAWKEFSIGTEEPIDLEDGTGYIELEAPEGSDTYLTIDGDDIATSEIGDRIMFQLRDIKTNAVLSQAEVPVVKDGINGGFKSRVFRRTNTNLTEAPKGGTYENPIPDGGEWSDGIPQGAEILWSSVCTFYADGRSSGWSKPAQETDTATLDIEFSPSQGEPPAPQGNTPFSNHESEGWYDPNSDS